jgi:RNA polymerase sigma-70 factor (ECF subfamily)
MEASLSAAPLGSLDDPALIERVKAQDSRAHRVLFDRYYTRVFSFLQRRLRDPELAEETAADVFFEIWRNAGAFRGASLASTWIFGIAHFKCLEADRRRRRMKRSQVLPTNVEFLHRVADERSLSADIDARAELRRVAEILRRLPAEQRTTIELALVEGLAYDEIATRLGVPEGTIKARVARARARLRSGIGLAAEEEA